MTIQSSKTSAILKKTKNPKIANDFFLSLCLLTDGQVKYEVLEGTTDAAHAQFPYAQQVVTTRMFLLKIFELVVDVCARKHIAIVSIR